MRPMPCSTRPLVRMLPANASSRFQALDQLPQPHSSLPSETERPSIKGGSLRPGWVLFHANTQLEVSKSCSESANEGTPTCEHCSFMAHAPSYNNGPSRPLA